MAAPMRSVQRLFAERHRLTFSKCAHYPSNSVLRTMEVLARIIYFLAIVIAARIGVFCASSPGSSRPEGLPSTVRRSRSGAGRARREHGMRMVSRFGS